MVEDQSEGSLSNTPTNSRLDNQFSVCEDYALKVRKPYTITKQREKWTQDEHRKFLEALKLYGRSWPQIEEHVGSKTAVQIRSHAQKFFSKVVRESSGSDGTEAGSIEIPPPRAKRKPTRPYPRKVSPPLKKRAGLVRSTCHDSSGSNHEITSSSSPECLSIQSLKLFGKTVFVTGSTRPSSVDTVTTLRWNSMSSLVPESPTTCGLSGYGDLAYCIVRSSDRIEPTTQCCSEDSKNGEFGKSSVLTGEEREELRVRLCL